MYNDFIHNHKILLSKEKLRLRQREGLRERLAVDRVKDELLKKEIVDELLKKEIVDELLKKEVVDEPAKKEVVDEPAKKERQASEKDLKRPENWVHLPPGHKAKTILSFIFSRKTFANIFAQAIADMRDEHAAALRDGEYRRARWIVIRDHIGLGLTIFAFLNTSVVKRVAGIWKLL